MERRRFLRRAASGGVATGLLSTGLAAPAIAQERREMSIVSVWPRDLPGVGTSAQRLADRITELSDGRIVSQYFAAGEKVGPFDVFDDVASGNSNAYIGADYYWKGKHPGLSYFTGVPFGMTYAEHNAWMKHGGGNELMNELKADFGLWGVLCGNTGCQMGGWFNKEIETADDLKGLKMRIPGIGGDVMAKLGASPVSLPPGEIYQNLVSGTIDATEWVGPYNDYFMKLYEAARYYYYPGMHEPGSAVSLTMNAAWWGELSEWEKQVLVAAAYEENANSMDEATALNGEYLQKMIDENGIELREFSDEVYDTFAEASLAVFEETRAHSEIAARIDDSFQKSLREIGHWMQISDIAYSNKRNRALGWT